jgi:membrane-associated phospholipid phosphatase
MEKKNYIILLISFYILNAIIISIVLATKDLEIVIYWSEQNISGSFLDNITIFMNRSMFDGDGFGGQDVSYILMIISLIVHPISFIKPIKVRMESMRMYSGFLIAIGLTQTIVGRAFKAIFARVRPYQVVDDHSLYSPMWTFGNYSIDDAISKGSFISGHTMTAIYLISFAFFMIKTHKPWKIIISFLISIAWAILMGFSRVVDVEHYPSDVFWSTVIGIAMVVWLYFVVFNIPKQESGELNQFEKGEEFRWSLLFVIVTVLFTIAIISFRYIFLEIIYYQPIYVVFCSMLGYFLIRRMKKLMTVLNS